MTLLKQTPPQQQQLLHNELLQQAKLNQINDLKILNYIQNN